MLTFVASVELGPGLVDATKVGDERSEGRHVFKASQFLTFIRLGLGFGLGIGLGTGSGMGLGIGLGLITFKTL